jgi:NTP pyrophosphatase (non-canonical NTP hydrolase)
MKSQEKSSLISLQKDIRKFCDDRNWDQFHNPKDLAISLVLEATEVMEHFQWKNSNEIEDHIEKNKNKVSEELADTLYWVILLANKLNIDLVKSFKNKMIKNEKKYPIEKAINSHKKYTDLNK